MKNIFLISIIFSILLLQIPAQGSGNHLGRIDSLTMKLNQTNLDVINRIDVLNALIKAYWKILPDSSLSYGKQALELQEQLNNDSIKAELMGNIGVAYFYDNSYESALNYLYKALGLWQRLGDKNKTGIAYNSIGNVFFSLNNTKKAMEYYTKSLDIMEKSGNQKMVAATLVNMGSLYNASGQNEKAFDALNRSIKILEQLKDSAALSSALNNLGMVYKENRSYNKALEYNLRALDISTRMNNFWEIAYISNTIGELYLIQKKYEDAGNYFKQGLNYAQKIGTLDIMLYSYRSLTYYYSSIGNNAEFINYFKKYDAIKDSIFTTQNTRSIAEMQVKYETEQKEKENAIQKLQIAKEKDLRNSFIFTSIIILIVVIVLFSRYRVKRKLNIELEAKVQQRTADLLKNQDKLKEAQRIGKSGSWDWDLLNRSFDWSDELMKILSVPLGSKLTIRYLLRSVQDVDRHLIIKALRKEFSGSNELIFDFRLHTPGNTIKYLTLQGEITFNSSSEPIYIQGTIQDITDRKLAESALRASEELYRKLIAALPDPVLQTDKNGNITFASDQSRTLFNIESNKEITGTNLGDWVVNSEKQKMKSCIEDVFNEVEESGSQFLLQRKDGSTFPGEIKIAVVTAQEGNAKGLIAVVRDITDRKLIEQRILRNTIETEERERTRFSEDLHDGLGPLLSTVKIHLELITARIGNPQEQQKFIAMTNELLDESIMSTREIANNLTPNLLNDFGLIEALIVYVEKINKTGTLQIELSIGDKVQRPQPHVEVASYRILCELINNTLKHASASRIQIKLSGGSEYLHVSYMDNGIGFDVRQTLNSKNKGLGLSNIFSRLKSVNGTYTFRSEPGKFFEAIIIVSLTGLNTPLFIKDLT